VQGGMGQATIEKQVSKHELIKNDKTDNGN
jgi:hypothetical protein